MTSVPSKEVVKSVEPPVEEVKPETPAMPISNIQEDIQLYMSEMDWGNPESVQTLMGMIMNARKSVSNPTGGKIKRVVIDYE